MKLGTSSYLRALVILLLLGLGLRALRWGLEVEVVEIEGSEYGRLAENLRDGQGYVGLIPGPALMLPPLYPIAIAGALPVASADTVIAARLVSLLASLVTIFALHRLVWITHGARAAWNTGLLAAALPALILTGTAAFSEGLLIALLSVSLLGLERTCRTGSLWAAAGTGIALGAGYLTRVEALPVALGALGAVVWSRRRVGASSLRPVCVLALAMGLAAAPYPLWLASVVDSPSWAGKSARVFATIERFSHGMEIQEASYALGSDGAAEGPWLHPNHPWTGDGAATIVGRNFWDITQYGAQNLGKNLFALLTGKAVCSILAWLPIIWGLRRGAHSASSRAVDFQLGWLTLMLLTMASIYKVTVRYTTPLAIPVVMLAGRGIAAWSEGPGSTRSPKWSWGFVLVIVASCSRGWFTGHGEFGEAHTSHEGVETVGAVLASAAPRDAVVLAGDSRVPFFGRTLWQPTPIARDSEEFLRFAQKTGARWLVVTTVAAQPSPRPGPWFDPAAPPPEWRLVTESRHGDRTVRLFARDD